MYRSGDRLKLLVVDPASVWSKRWNLRKRLLYLVKTWKERKEKRNEAIKNNKRWIGNNVIHSTQDSSWKKVEEEKELGGKRVDGKCITTWKINCTSTLLQFIRRFYFQPISIHGSIIFLLFASIFHTFPHFSKFIFHFSHFPAIKNNRLIRKILWMQIDQKTEEAGDLF